MNKIIAVTIGDIKGIGIELLLKYRAKKKNCEKFVLFTNSNLLKKYFNKNNINIKINIINNSLNTLKLIDYKKQINIYNFKAKNNAENTYQALKESYNLTKLKYFMGILTLPLNKNIINKKIDKNFFGQTEFFQKLDKKKLSNMVFINHKMIFLTLTNHIPLIKVISKLKKKELYL